MYQGRQKEHCKLKFLTKILRLAYKVAVLHAMLLSCYQREEITQLLDLQSDNKFTAVFFSN